MSWGNKLLIVFVIFGGGMSYMVYRCMKTPVDLVSEHYYSDELAYQEVIDGTKRASALSGRLELHRTAAGLWIGLPAEMKNKQTEGAIYLYCPSDVSKDRRIVWSIRNGGQEIRIPDREAGHYIAKVSWRAEGIGYFAEQPIVLP